MQSFKSKVVVITGAGSGIGRELALQLAEKGAVLALNDRDEANLEATWEQLPEAARGYLHAFDVSDRTEVEAFATAVAKALGRVDMVVNNAGFTLPVTAVVNSTVEDYERILAVNLWGVIYGSLAFLPHLQRQPESCLVNISSVFGLMGMPGQGPYNVSKFGVRGFTETLRAEMKGTGLQAVCVHPGGIKTNIARNIDNPDRAAHDRFVRRFDKMAKTTAKEAAGVIIKGVARGKHRILIGGDARFIDRITRLLPASYERILSRGLDRVKLLNAK